MDSKNSLINIFLAQNIIGFEPKGLTLKSGKLSYWYANCRTLTQTTGVLHDVADIVEEYIKVHFIAGFDAVIGVPEGATFLGYEVHRNLIECAYFHDKIYSLRVTEKKHGDPVNKFWVNGNMPTKVLLLEDVTTTAGSVLELAEKLQTQMGIEVVGILSLFDRLELDKNKNTVVEKMKNAGFEYASILNASDILQEVINTLPADLKNEAIEKINREFFTDYQDRAPIVLK